MLLHIHRAERHFERGCPEHQLVLSDSLECPVGHSCSVHGEDERLADSTTMRWLVLEVVNGAVRRVAGSVYWHRHIAGRDREGFVGLGPHHNAAKTHCPHGHPYDEANTYVKTRKDGRVKRVCATCEHEHKRRYREARALAQIQPVTGGRSMKPPVDVGPVGQAGHLFEPRGGDALGRKSKSGDPALCAECGLPASAHPASKPPGCPSRHQALGGGLGHHRRLQAAPKEARMSREKAEAAVRHACSHGAFHANACDGSCGEHRPDPLAVAIEFAREEGFKAGRAFEQASFHRTMTRLGMPTRDGDETACARLRRLAAQRTEGKPAA